MSFATTKRLILRPYRDSDGELLAELYNDPDVARGSSPDHIVPQTLEKTKQFADRLNGALFHAIIEVRPDIDPSRAGVQEDKDRWAGHVVLSTSGAKNRNGTLGIALKQAWWGEGFGFEVVQWIVKYAFEQLAMHRISLGVFSGNERAIRLYQKA